MKQHYPSLSRNTLLHCPVCVDCEVVQSVWTLESLFLNPLGPVGRSRISRDPAGRVWIKRDMVLRPPRSTCEHVQTVQGGYIADGKVGGWVANFGKTTVRRSSLQVR